MIYPNVNEFIVLHILILHTLINNLKISPFKATLHLTSTFTTPEICQLFIGQGVACRLKRPIAAGEHDGCVRVS